MKKSITASAIVKSILSGGGLRFSPVDDSKRRPDKFCTYHSLLWQIGLKPAPERPHQLTQRLAEVNGRPNGVRTLAQSMREYIERLTRSDQRVQVRLALSEIVGVDAVAAAQRVAIMLERSHKALQEISDEDLGGKLCATLQEFRMVSIHGDEVKDGIDLIFETKVHYTQASACIGKALMRVLGTLMHRFAKESNSVYDCPISRTSYIPFTDFEDPNVPKESEVVVVEDEDEDVVGEDDDDDEEYDEEEDGDDDESERVSEN
jgi:hypothetical protein